MLPLTLATSISRTWTTLPYYSWHSGLPKGSIWHPARRLQSAQIGRPAQPSPINLAGRRLGNDQPVDFSGEGDPTLFDLHFDGAPLVGLPRAERVENGNAEIVLGDDGRDDGLAGG